MNGVLKDLYTSMKGKKSVFSLLSDEDVENLSTFFEIKNILAGETLWKEEDPSSRTGYGDNDRVAI